MWIEPIYDRTQADVDLIRLDPINENTKGAYNYTDLNRIEYDCEFISKLRNRNPLFSNVDIVVKTDWNVYDIPTIEDINRIRNNILLLISEIDKGDFETIEFTNTMDYIKANILERNLNLINEVLENAQKELRRCNTFFCGTMGLGIYVDKIYVKSKLYTGVIYCGKEINL